MEEHIAVLNELKKFAEENSAETRKFVQYACCLVDSKGEKYFAVTTFPEVVDMKDKCKKMIRSRYAPMNAGEKYLEANKTEEERKANPIVTVYTYPAAPCGVDVHRYMYMGPELHIVFPTPPVDLATSWIGIKESFDTILHKMVQSNIAFTYVPRKFLNWTD